MKPSEMMPSSSDLSLWEPPERTVGRFRCAIETRGVSWGSKEKLARITAKKAPIIARMKWKMSGLEESGYDVALRVSERRPI